MAKALIDSPIGLITVIANDLGVSQIWFGDLEDNGYGTACARTNLSDAVDQLRDYFDGNRTTFTMPIDRQHRRGFRGEVLDALERVQFGSVVTYGELARRSGRPNAARAVGTAMATNPIAIVVPCHRVIPSSGGIGKFGGGLSAKEWLLRLEGVLDDLKA